MRAVARVIAVAVHFGAVAAGFIGVALAKPELPPLPGGDIIGVVPIWLNPVSLTQGATESQVDRVFGASGSTIGMTLGDRCVRYKYSSRMAYVVRFRAGRAFEMWLTENGFVPYRCEDTLSRTVAIPARPWYPERSIRIRHECGCGPLDMGTCSVE